MVHDVDQARDQAPTVQRAGPREKPLQGSLVFKKDLYERTTIHCHGFRKSVIESIPKGRVHRTRILSISFTL